MKKLLVPTLALLALLFTACDENSDDEMTEGNLKLSVTNLMASASGEQYEGWIIVDGAPVSTGTFTVDASGEFSQSSFIVDLAQLNSATDFVLSIEPMPDADPAPSAIKILGGSFSGTSATITAAHGAALGNDFSSVMGKYILATPTSSSMDDDLSGVWFIDASSGSMEAGLDLPSLPSGWKYEGWAVIDGKPVTTGTFSMVDKADDAAPYSGTDMDGPMFPGEDFIMHAPDGLSFPTDLSESTIVISIEPSPDNSAEPFLFKPLVGTVPASAEAMTTYELSSNVAGSFPTGTVMR